MAALHSLCECDQCLDQREQDEVFIREICNKIDAGATLRDIALEYKVIFTIYCTGIEEYYKFCSPNMQPTKEQIL